MTWANNHISDADRAHVEGTVGAALTAHLVEKGLLTKNALDRAERVADESNERFNSVLTRLGLVSERDLANAFAEVLSIPTAETSDYPSDPVLSARFNQSFLKEARVLPLAERDDGVAIAFVDPLDTYAKEAARFAVKRPILPFVATESDFQAAFERLYRKAGSALGQIVDNTGDRGRSDLADDVERLKDIASDAPVIRLVNLLITNAVDLRASDIHIEPLDGELRVRYRIDGMLHETEAPPNHLAAAIISRVKLVARLNIAERRLPQDGRIRLAVRGTDIDFRVSTTPTIHGESVVLRVLDRSSLALDFDALGFSGALKSQVRALIRRPHGIVLVTGPTGSGKTTTLYAALSELNSREKKLLTIEDPVEYQLPGVNQVQVKPQIGYGFASALRSFLRQDPDIMMVGEIRDIETAQIAIQAALTGHLILSTLHTNDAASALTRLMDMGVAEYLLAATINGILAQRLVRTLCHRCRTPYEPPGDWMARFDIRTDTPKPTPLVYRASGCEACNGTGYAGRSAIVEVLPVSEPLRRLVLERAPATRIAECARDEGMTTLLENGMQKVEAGLTSLEEVLRVVQEA